MDNFATVFLLQICNSNDNSALMYQMLLENVWGIQCLIIIVKDVKRGTTRFLPHNTWQKSTYKTLNFMNVKSGLRQNESGATRQQMWNQIFLLIRQSRKAQNAFTIVDEQSHVSEKFDNYEYHTKLTSFSDFTASNTIGNGYTSSSSVSSSTFTSITRFSSWDDFSHVSLHEPVSAFTKSIQFCKTTIILAAITVSSHLLKHNTSASVEVLTAVLLQIHIFWILCHDANHFQELALSTLRPVQDDW